ncbi:hypothetical protein [Variovorax saccharolyticus]|uniref:hypothetical protein n=1 Tax=Variovorax saccharolyticus TaxID=3053516 RepID=UPI002576F323|nr:MULTISPECIES: hypothetical protein [unclassified Variovorax]MDM0021050.1 hypothetical protein [Variovorax sp. J22R187]MDM0025409.1 hypothetical protein [Variovorax sp. J31P216]
MQPVVELRKLASSYTYGVRAPRAGGVVPPVSFREIGFATLADCLLHVARGLGGNFPRIYVRLEGHCVGERDISALRREPARVAAELEAAYRAAREAQPAPRKSTAEQALSG